MTVSGNLERLSAVCDQKGCELMTSSSEEESEQK